MRSIFAKILLWSFGTLAFSLVAFVVISRFLSDRAFRRSDPVRRTLAMQAEDAREAFETGGRERLDLYLRRLYQFFPDEHYLTDNSGRDLLTGADRSSLLTRDRLGPGAARAGGRPILVTTVPSNPHYRFIVVLRGPPFDPWGFIPYYFLVLLAVGILCYVLAVNLATPLRVLGKAVEGFGQGNLSVRVNSRRRDEIGDLSRAFDNMADRIQTLLRAERRLLQDISHELRSPLARLSFALELVRTAEDRETAVARVRREIDRLTHLVGGLLQVTRGEGDPSSLNLEDVSLNNLLQELASDCSIEAEARRCRLLLNDGQPVLVRGDRELLRRAIENILRNAIRHTPEGTPVEITLDRQQQSVSVSIRDYGLGVPEELLAEIFKPFFRADNARDSSSGGVGLGLAIARRAVTLHRGKLSAANMSPGLQVCLELPYSLPPANP
jgi:signal transduction histidine kinase